MNSAFEWKFIRHSLAQNLRIDGRGASNGREVEVVLKRSMSVLSSSSSSAKAVTPRATAEVVIGDTKVVCITTGTITEPFPDRPTEGQIVFSVTIPTAAKSALFDDKNEGRERERESELCRLLERSLRDSEAVDTESLCIVAGQLAWELRCDIKVLDDCGNASDAASLAAAASLRAFRRPEVTISREAAPEGSPPGTIFRTAIIVHTEDEREPLPLALHHTPVSITFGIFKGIANETTGSVATVLVLDPNNHEEVVIDGSISFSINAQREICSILKPGGSGITATEILAATKMAVIRAEELHTALNQAVLDLDARLLSDRSERLEQLRQYNQALAASESGDYAPVSSASGNKGLVLDKDDPILQWGSLHQAVRVREDDE